MKNIELKTKKMSLANIEGKLSVIEMETIMAGSGGCGLIGFMHMATVAFLGNVYSTYWAAGGRVCLSN
jgi:hypothetical protein